MNVAPVLLVPARVFLGGLVFLIVFAAAAPLCAQAPVLYRGTVLDLPSPDSWTGPAGRFWLPGWDWPADVDREHEWPVNPRTYSIRILSLGEQIVGQVEALKPGGDDSTRFLVWNRALRPEMWGRNANISLSTEDGWLLYGGGRGGSVIASDGRREVVLSEMKLEDWRPVGSDSHLLVGSGVFRGTPAMAAVARVSSRTFAVLVTPSRVRPVNVNDVGWVIGSDQRAPVVFGPLLRDGKLVKENQLDDLAPLEWHGPERAELVAFCGDGFVGNVSDASGGKTAWFWPLDTRADSAGEGGVELPAADGSAKVIDANADGQVIGWSGGQPVLWELQKGEWRRIDLRRCLPKNIDYSLINVVAINKRGQIAGSVAVTHENGRDSFVRGVLLTRRRG